MGKVLLLTGFLRGMMQPCEFRALTSIRRDQQSMSRLFDGGHVFCGSLADTTTSMEATRYRRRTTDKEITVRDTSWLE
jgi:hypothetical protein